jgi:shikimate dehydrogenase
VVGAGGAGRAVALALGAAGASEVVVVARSPERAAEAASLAGSAGRVGRAIDATGADLVVNATPVGMEGTPAAGGLPVDPELLVAGQLVVDLVYAPRPSRWLELAARRGAVTLDGLGMLVHQAARQIELWTAQRAPVEAMWRAVAGDGPHGRPLRRDPAR